MLGRFSVAPLLLTAFALASCKAPVGAASAVKDAATAPALRGVVRSVTGDRALFSTADRDLEVDLKRLPPPVAAQLRDNIAGKDTMTAELPPDSLKEVGRPPLGVRADCSELPLTFDAAAKLAAASSGINDFIARLPAGTMQTFTLVYDSQSPLREDVSYEWPRVVRMNRDASLYLAYTCNPDKPSYDKLELLAFDEATARYKLARVNFRDNAAAHAVDADPPECMRCHAPDPQAPDPRPIWEGYSTWRGVYGSEDDSFNAIPALQNDLNGPMTPDAIALKVKELAHFVAFKASAQVRDNPCFAELPWAKVDAAAGKEFIAAQRKIAEAAVQPGYPPLPAEIWPSSFGLYPYSDGAKARIYEVRPNLKLTEIASRRMAKRLVRKLTEHPAFARLKHAMYLVAADKIVGRAASTSYCALKDTSKVKSILPAFSTAAWGYGGLRGSSMDPQEVIPEVYAMARAMGIKDSDWTMSFLTKDLPTYSAAIPGIGENGDLSIPDAVTGELMLMSAQESVEVKRRLRYTPGTVPVFGGRFACIDQFGGGVSVDHDADYDTTWVAPFCTKLLANWAKVDPQPYVAPAIASVRPSAGAGATASDTGGDAALAAGWALVQANCARCHSTPPPEATRGVLPQYRFFETPEGLRAKLAATPTFAQDLAERLGSASEPMPPTGRLPPPDRDALIAYFRALNAQRP